MFCASRCVSFRDGSPQTYDAMPFLLALLALFIPRLVIIGLWLFSTWFVGVFATLLWPLLGFIFAPTTLLWYSVVVNLMGGTWDVVALIGLAVAIMLDLSPAAGRRE